MFEEDNSLEMMDTNFFKINIINNYVQVKHSKNMHVLKLRRTYNVFVLVG